VIKREHGVINVDCDGERCSAILPTQTRDFGQAKRVMAKNGWAVVKTNEGPIAPLWRSRGAPASNS
jgi:hypothetical protein